MYLKCAAALTLLSVSRPLRPSQSRRRSPPPVRPPARARRPLSRGAAPPCPLRPLRLLGVVDERRGGVSPQRVGGTHGGLARPSSPSETQ